MTLILGDGEVFKIIFVNYRHISVPACCVPPSRIPEEAQVTFNARRAAVPVHLVDKMLFLHANHSF